VGSRPDLRDVPAQLGRYRLCFKLASGGMASVFLARSLGTGSFEKVVAVKLLHAHLTEEQGVVRMFMDEARITSAISHPNVANVFDFGEQDDTHYLVMEYLCGEPLSRVARRLSNVEDGPLRERLAFYAARLIADAAEGLHAAHELRDPAGVSLDVVHRDVSPQNIFVTYGGAVKVVDFGIARARARLEQTRAGDFKGKYEYCAPEQLRGRAFDRRVDLWALGVCLWELLTLRRLFRREEVVATIAAISDEPIARPSEVASHVPAALDDIVLRALSRDPASRYATARELSRALREFLARSGQLVDTPEVGEWMSALFPEDKRKREAMRDMVIRSDVEALEPAPVPVEFTVREESRSGKAPPPRRPPGEATATDGTQPDLTVVQDGKRRRDAGADGGHPAAETLRDDAAAPPGASPRLLLTALTLGALAVTGGLALLLVPAPAGDETELPAAPVIPAAVAPRPPEPPVAVDAAVAEATPPEAAAPDAGGAIAEVPGAPPRAPVAVVEPAPRPPPKSERRAPAVAAPAEKAPPRPPRPVMQATGLVRVRAPEAMEVFIDGKLSGTTPLQLELPVGPHRIELRTPGAPAGSVRQVNVEFAAEYLVEAT
jgi:serine/threonine protein kinase